jgi:hypothetical protein
LQDEGQGKERRVRRGRRVRGEDREKKGGGKPGWREEKVVAQQADRKAVDGLTAALNSSGLIKNKCYDLVVSINGKQK